MLNVLNLIHLKDLIGEDTGTEMTVWLSNEMMIRFVRNRGHRALIDDDNGAMKVIIMFMHPNSPDELYSKTTGAIGETNCSIRGFAKFITALRRRAEEHDNFNVKNWMGNMRNEWESDNEMENLLRIIDCCMDDISDDSAILDAYNDEKNLVYALDVAEELVTEGFAEQLNNSAAWFRELACHFNGPDYGRYVDEIINNALETVVPVESVEE